jgi:TetR/AcrR family transcriptional repressor of nem operon
MGRRRSLSREELLENAVGIFREHGFAGTSADMLVEKIGVSRYSLYSDFGSKQGLFDAALERYDRHFVDRRFGPLEAEGSGLSDVFALLDFYGNASTGPASGLGCLLCNTAVEFGPIDPSGKSAVQSYFRRLSASFENALRNAQCKGELSASADPEKEAGHLTALILGLFVMLRAKAPEATVRHAAQSAKEHLEALAA